MHIHEDHIGAALRDYALDQLAEADLQLARAGAWQDNGIHSARKALARLRAVVELLRKSPLAARPLERRLRGFAHGLSPLRDAQAAVATARLLRKQDHKLDDVWQDLTGELKREQDRVLGTALAADPGFSNRRAQLAEMRAVLVRIAWTRLVSADLRRALKRADKRARRARDPALASSGQDVRHRLRRRSRRLLLQIELLREIAQDEKKPAAASAARETLHGVIGKSLKRKRRKHLIDKLGWEQDLRVLRRALPARATSAAVRAAIAALRRELERAQAATNERV